MKGLTDMIAEIMTKDEKARNSDAYLYHAVCLRISPVALTTPFGTVIQDPKKYGLPSSDTVSRLRRKIQSECTFAELGASKQVKAWRDAKEERCRAGCFE